MNGLIRMTYLAWVGFLARIIRTDQKRKAIFHSATEPMSLSNVIRTAGREPLRLFWRHSVHYQTLRRAKQPLKYRRDARWDGATALNLLERLHRLERHGSRTLPGRRAN